MNLAIQQDYLIWHLDKQTDYEITTTKTKIMLYHWKYNISTKFYTISNSQVFFL